MHCCAVSTQFCDCVLQPTSNSPRFASHVAWHCTWDAAVEFAHCRLGLGGPFGEPQQMSPGLPCDAQFSALEHVIGI
jgi:hypothetical protein